MRQAVSWFFLSCRRYLKRLSFLAVLLALPAAAFLLNLADKSGDNRIRIAVCTEPAGSAQTALSFRLLAALTDAGVPAAQRERIPVLCAGERPLAAYGIGTDADFLPEPGGPGLIIEIDHTEDT